MHGKGTASILVSTMFLIAYAKSLQVRRQGSKSDPDGKGKEKVYEGCLGRKAPENKAGGEQKREDWKPPPHGWLKINTDAGFCMDTGEASAGVVIKDERGKVILAAGQMPNHSALLRRRT
jgi:hypothetical protein